MRQKKLFSVLLLGWIFLSLFSLTYSVNGVNIDALNLTEFNLGDKVVYSYKTYYYQNPITGFAWSPTKYELYNITEISEINNEITIKADFWDKSSLQNLTVEEPDEENIVLGRLKIPPNLGDIIIPNNIQPKDYKTHYLAQMNSQINNPEITSTIQSYAKGQGLYIKHMYASKIIGEHTLLYATTGILLKISYKISMGTTNDFTAEKEIVPSRSTIDGADEFYSDTIINPWSIIFIIGVPSVILSVVIIRKIVLKSNGIQVIKQELSPNSTPIKKSRVLCPFCYTEIQGDDIYCSNCGKKI